MRIRLILTLLLFLQGTLAGAAQVGLRTWQLADDHVNRDIEVALWYPLSSDQSAPETEIFGLPVARNARPLPDSLPLIIISHGFSGHYYGHRCLAHYLAQNHFVVLTPLHADIADLQSAQTARDPLLLRPQQIRRVLDSVLASGSSYGEIAMIGYSLGAYTTLVSLGAQPDFSRFTTYCAENSADMLLCSAASQRRLSRLVDMPTATRDVRIKAAVLLAPAYGPLFTPAALARVEVPVMIFSAQHDEELNNDYHAAHIASLLPHIAQHDIVDGASHYTFMAPCSAAAGKMLPSFICNDARGIDRAQIHRDMHKTILQFFNEVLQKQ